MHLPGVLAVLPNIRKKNILRIPEEEEEERDLHLSATFGHGNMKGINDLDGNIFLICHFHSWQHTGKKQFHW